MAQSSREALVATHLSALIGAVAPQIDEVRDYSLDLMLRHVLVAKISSPTQFGLLVSMMSCICQPLVCHRSGGAYKFIAKVRTDHHLVSHRIAVAKPPLAPVWLTNH
jgi:hypothetical protein